MVFIQLIYQSNLSTNYTSGGAFWLLMFHSHLRVEKTIGETRPQQRGKEIAGWREAKS
jgi:hypothetical protein